jgi:hypothetical protein
MVQFHRRSDYFASFLPGGIERQPEQVKSKQVTFK